MKRSIKILLFCVTALLTLTALALTVLAANNGEAAAASADSSDFLYVKNGVATYSTSEQELADVIELADADSEINFLDDVFVYTPGNAIYSRIRKGVTLDLNGHTLYFSQSLHNLNC